MALVNIVSANGTASVIGNQNIINTTMDAATDASLVAIGDVSTISLTAAEEVAALTQGNFTGSTVDAGTDVAIASYGTLQLSSVTAGGDISLASVGNLTANVQAAGKLSASTYGDLDGSYTVEDDIVELIARGNINGSYISRDNVDAVFSYGEIDADITAGGAADPTDTDGDGYGYIREVIAWNDAKGTLRADTQVTKAKAGGEVVFVVESSEGQDPEVQESSEHDRSTFQNHREFRPPRKGAILAIETESTVAAGVSQEASDLSKTATESNAGSLLTTISQYWDAWSAICAEMRTMVAEAGNNETTSVQPAAEFSAEDANRREAIASWLAADIQRRHIAGDELTAAEIKFWNDHVTARYAADLAKTGNGVNAHVDKTVEMSHASDIVNTQTNQSLQQRGDRVQLEGSALIPKTAPSGLQQGNTVVLPLPMPRGKMNDETTEAAAPFIAGKTAGGTFSIDAYKLWDREHDFAAGQAAKLPALGFAHKITFIANPNTTSDDIRIVMARRAIELPSNTKYPYPDDNHARITKSGWTIYARYRPLAQPFNSTKPSIYLADPDGGMGEYLFPNDGVASRGRYGDGKNSAFVQNSMLIANHYFPNPLLITKAPTKRGTTVHGFYAAAYCNSTKTWLGAIQYAIVVNPTSKVVTLQANHPVLQRMRGRGVLVQATKEKGDSHQI